jgi:hypothetical protein
MHQNHSKLNKIIDATKGNLGLFWGIFWKNFRGEIGWVEGQILGNQELLIPNDEA